MAWAIADVAVGADNDRTGGRVVGDAGDYEVVGADQDRGFDLAEAHAGAAEFVRAQALCR